MLADIVNNQCKSENVALLIVNDEINNKLLSTVSENVKLICLHRKTNSKSLFPFIRLNEEILRFRPDVIHCHNHNLINTLFLSCFKKRTILTIHTTNVDTLNFSKYRQCYAISQSVKQDIMTRSKITVKVIHNGVYTDLIEKRNSPFSTDPSKVKIVQVSRLLHATKGQHLVLNALKKLRDQGIGNIEFDLIGEGPSMAYLESLANEYGIIDSVNFLGLKDRAYIYRHLKDYDLLIQPSLYEGFGLTIVEAMAAKVPVLVSDIEGPMEVIKDGKHGIFFKKGDSDDLAQKILLFAGQLGKESQVNKINEASKYANDSFNVAKTSLSYLDEYKNI